MERSKKEMLQILKNWAATRHNTIKVLTTYHDKDLHMTGIEIAFISNRLHVVDFLIKIVKWENREKWQLVSFTEMFESVFPIFKYLNDVIQGE